MDEMIGLGSVYLRYKQNATARGYKFNLTRKAFAVLIDGACHYCGYVGGSQLSKGLGKYKVRYTGIDRLDNTKGYIKGNVVTCCKVCNRAKKDLSYGMFIDYIQRLCLNILKRGKHELT